MKFSLLETSRLLRSAPFCERIYYKYITLVDNLINTPKSWKNTNTEETGKMALRWSIPSALEVPPSLVHPCPFPCLPSSLHGLSCPHDHHELHVLYFVWTNRWWDYIFCLLIFWVGSGTSKDLQRSASLDPHQWGGSPGGGFQAGCSIECCCHGCWEEEKVSLNGYTKHEEYDDIFCQHICICLSWRLTSGNRG